MTLMRRSLIIDTDIGDDIDDALAIAFALGCPEVEIQGISVVHGEVDLRARLLGKLLNLSGHDDIPIGIGALEPYNQCARRGIVQYQARVLNEEERLRPLHHCPASELYDEILDSVHEPVEILTIGPLTNIAQLISTRHQAKDFISGITMMAGNFSDPFPEYNVNCDPEAANIVFQSGIPIRVIGFDITENCRMDNEVIKGLKSVGHPLMDFLHELIQIWIPLAQGHLPVLHDPLAAAALIRPDYFNWRQAAVRVELDSRFHRGVTEHQPGKANCQIVTGFQEQEFQTLFRDRLFALAGVKI